VGRPVDPDFAHFAAAQSRPLLSFAHALTANPHDAWDLTQGDRTVDVSSNGPDDSPSGPLVLFMADSPDGARRANEVSSTASGAGSGSVRVLRASCSPTPVLELEVDATLASELRNHDDLTVSGDLR
jgi:hypothetical protein